ncbi:hypothetical protein RB2150_15485 [Rhodobacterales bacterium HTCC2150]|nr:hypothetical protein RB2150_15485 [Rhodobacterales bacterium HTCC2150] [Rhodobacteraceae bacterium HTCC2150]
MGITNPANYPICAESACVEHFSGLTRRDASDFVQPIN